MKSIIVMGLLMTISFPAFADKEGLNLVAQVSQMVREAFDDAKKMSALPGNQKRNLLSPQSLEVVYDQLLQKTRSYIGALPAGKLKDEATDLLADRLADIRKAIETAKSNPSDNVVVKKVNRKTTVITSAAAAIMLAASGVNASTGEPSASNQAFDVVGDGVISFLTYDLLSADKVLAKVEELSGKDLNTWGRLHPDDYAVAIDRVASILGSTATQYDPNATSAAAQR